MLTACWLLTFSERRLLHFFGWYRTPDKSVQAGLPHLQTVHGERPDLVQPQAVAAGAAAADAAAVAVAAVALALRAVHACVERR